MPIPLAVHNVAGAQEEMRYASDAFCKNSRFRELCPFSLPKCVVSDAFCNTSTHTCQAKARKENL